MANWSLLRPLGFALYSRLFSPEMTLLDVYLTKCPNWKDGSDHSLSAGAVVHIGGTGTVSFDANFVASSANITITSGKFLAVTGTGSITGAATSHMVWRGDAQYYGVVQIAKDGSGTGELRITSGTQLNVLDGGQLRIAGGGPSGLGFPGGMEVLSGGTVVFGAGSVLYLNGAMTMVVDHPATVSVHGQIVIQSDGTFTVVAGATFTVATLATFNGAAAFNGAVGLNAITTIGGSGRLAFATGAIITGEIGGAFVYSAATVGGTRTENGDTTYAGATIDGTLMDSTSTNRDGPTRRTALAWDQKRPINGLDGDRTFTVAEIKSTDMIYVPAQTANHTYKLPPMGADETVEIRFDGLDNTAAFSVTIAKLDGTPILVLNSNAGATPFQYGCHMTWNASWRITATAVTP